MASRTPVSRLLVLGLGVGLGSSACKDPSAALSVRVCGALEVPREVDALRIVVLNEDRSEASAGVSELGAPTSPDMSTDGGSFDATPPPEDAGAGPRDGCVQVEHPVALEVTLAPGDGRGWVQVVALRGGVEVARAEVRHGTERAPSVVVALERACLGAACPLGQTCAAGTCVQVPQGGDPAACEACR